MISWKVDIKEILPFVPHRPPMVWVDEIVTFGEKSGECTVTMRQDALFWAPEGLRGTSCLEFIAQAYGYCSMAYTRMTEPDSPPLKRAYLASFKEAKLAEPTRMALVKIGDKIIVKYSGVRKIGQITMLNGQALHNGELLCQTQMKVFCED